MTNAMVIGAIASSLFSGGPAPTPTDPYWANVDLLGEYYETAEIGPLAQTLSIYGTASYSPTNKFGGGSLKTNFASNSQWNPAIEVESPAWALGANDFTIDFWIRDASEGSDTVIMGRSPNSGSTNLGWYLKWSASPNELGFYYSTNGTSYDVAIFDCDTDGVSAGALWDGDFHHVAIERVGSTITVYVDGNAGSTTGAIGAGTINATTAPLYLMNYGTTPSSVYFRGRIDDVRFTVGSYRYGAPFTPPAVEAIVGGGDAHWSNVKLLAKFDSIFGFYGVGSVSFTPYPAGRINQKYITADGITGAASNACVAGYGGGTSYALGSSDFTIEVFGAKANTWTNRLAFCGQGSRNRGTARVWRLEQITGGKLRFYYYDTSNVEAYVEFATTFSSGVAYDLAVERNGSTLRLYVNGAVDTTTAFTTSMKTDGTAALGVNGTGSPSGLAEFGNVGSVKGFRLTKAARYSGAYTVPALPLPKS